MPTPITYTFATAPGLPDAIRGKTLTGGRPEYTPDGGKPIRVVAFPDVRIGGKIVMVRVADKPDLVAAVATYEAEVVAERQAAADAIATALEAAVPGVGEILKLADAASAEVNRYGRQFDAMMDDGDNDGARPPKPFDKTIGARLDAALVANPRAALYLRAKRQADQAGWADNTGSGAAGRKAMEILAQGGTEADGEAALAVRRDWVD